MENKKLYLFDLDGTLLLGDQVIDGAIEAINKIREAGKKFLIFTNNSSRTRKQYVEKLTKLGFNIKEDEIVTAGYITGKYLIKKNKKNIYVLGTKKFKEMLEELGLNVVENPIKIDGKYNVDAVVLGLDTELTYEKLQTACNLLQDSNLTYIGANPDLVFPVENGIFYPDCGSIAKMLFYSVKRFPKFLGKPHHEILDYCLEKKGVSKDETVIIGDRLYTDIACGQENGCDTILIFSGEARKEDLINSEYQPTLFLDSIKELKIK